MNNISYSEKPVASNVSDSIVTCFLIGFDQMKVICFSQSTVLHFTGEVNTFIII